MEHSRPTGPMGSTEPTPQSTDTSSPAPEDPADPPEAPDQPTHSPSWLLALGALGVVFGDIGTSPLYALHTAFSMEHNAVTIAPDNVYGLAVTGNLLLVTVLFSLFAARVWHWAAWRISLFAVIMGSVEIWLFSASATKLFDGGWLPLLIALILMVVMTTWESGSRHVARTRRALEGPLHQFMASLPHRQIRRVPGVAVFPHASAGTTPLALVKFVTDFHILPGHVVIVRIIHENVPHIQPGDRITVDEVGSASDGIVHVGIRVGFTDDQDIPRNLALAVDTTPELTIDLEQASYVLSVLTLRPSRVSRLRDWRQRLFLSLEKNQANRTEIFHPPTHPHHCAGHRTASVIHPELWERRNPPCGPPTVHRAGLAHRV
ncbi:KUP/HAK/KT family potassium transporter [Corynebacterium efficiens]|nr:KUP/HAK/KT family potassium transporter [Corynebacterium efficiens]